MKIPEKKTWKRKLFVFLTLVVIIGSGIYILKNLSVARAYTFFAPIGLGNAAAKTVKALNSGVDNTTKAVSKIAHSIAKAAAEKIQNQLADMQLAEKTQEVKDAAFNAISGGLNSGLNSIGSFIGADMPNNIIDKKNTSANAANKNCKQ